MKIVLIEEVSGGNNDKCASSFAKTAIFRPKRYLARHLTGVCIIRVVFRVCSSLVQKKIKLTTTLGSSDDEPFVLYLYKIL